MVKYLTILLICFVLQAKADNQSFWWAQGLVIASGGGGGGAPVYYNSVSNFLTSGATSYTTPRIVNGTNSPTFILNFAWYSTSSTVTTVTNNLGVAGTIIATNVWSPSCLEYTYIWGNSAMTNATMIFATGPAELSYFLVQFTNGATTSPFYNGIKTNTFAGASQPVYITNIVNSSASSGIVVSFSAEGADVVGTPTAGVTPITLIGTIGVSGDHYETSFYTTGAPSVTNDMTWSDTDQGSAFDLTTICVTNHP